MRFRAPWVFAPIALLLSGCTGLRTSSATRYLGILLNARNLGAAELDRLEADDPAIRDCLARDGPPDFLLEVTVTDVELVYYISSRLVYFHRSVPESPSFVGELSPLPNAVLNILPTDIRAGTPHKEDTPQPNCWDVGISHWNCRTCCVTGGACVGGCSVPRPPRSG